MGSTRIARRAGSHTASNAALSSSNGTDQKHNWIRPSGQSFCEPSRVFVFIHVTAAKWQRTRLSRAVRPLHWIGR
jgi:hypothetical protein